MDNIWCNHFFMIISKIINSKNQLIIVDDLFRNHFLVDGFNNRTWKANDDHDMNGDVGKTFLLQPFPKSITLEMHLGDRVGKTFFYAVFFHSSNLSIFTE